jgi:hypothetical protein
VRFNPDGTIDAEYTWGRHPTTYISPRWLPMLIALRGLLQDVRAGVHSKLYDLNEDKDLMAS